MEIAGVRGAADFSRRDYNARRSLDRRSVSPFGPFFVIIFLVRFARRRGGLTLTG